jgi:hypothetical protein
MDELIEPGTLLRCIDDLGATPHIRVGETYIVQKITRGFWFDQVAVRTDGKLFDLRRFEIVSSNSSGSTMYLTRGVSLVRSY